MFNAVRECNSNIINIFLKNKDIDLNIKNDRDLTLLDFTIKSINQNYCDFYELTWLARTATEFALNPRSEFNEEQKTKLINANNRIKHQSIKLIIVLSLVTRSCPVLSYLCMAYSKQLFNSTEVASQIIGGLGMFLTPFTAVCALSTFIILCYLLPKTIDFTRSINQANEDLEKSYQEKQNKLEQNGQDGEVQQDEPLSKVGEVITLGKNMDPMTKS